MCQELFKRPKWKGHGAYSTVPNMKDHIKKEITGQRVLDVGCLATWQPNMFKKHREYKETAKTIIGVDIHPNVVEIAKNKNISNIYYLDMASTGSETQQFKKKFNNFDAVVATDVYVLF